MTLPAAPETVASYEGGASGKPLPGAEGGGWYAAFSAILKFTTVFQFQQC